MTGTRGKNEKAMKYVMNVNNKRKQPKYSKTTMKELERETELVTRSAIATRLALRSGESSATKCGGPTKATGQPFTNEVMPDSSMTKKTR